MLTRPATIRPIVYTLINFCFTDLFKKKKDELAFCKGSSYCKLKLLIPLSDTSKGSPVCLCAGNEISKTITVASWHSWSAWWKTVIGKHPSLAPAYISGFPSNFPRLDDWLANDWRLAGTWLCCCLPHCNPIYFTGNSSKRQRKTEVKFGMDFFPPM